jgi:hypothetical protein
MVNGDESAARLSAFKRKNIVGILLHAETEKWASISGLFLASEFQAQRNNDTGNPVSSESEEDVPYRFIFNQING